MQKTILVTMHQQVIYCDDSGSMDEEMRWDSLKQLVRRITRITTRILPDSEGVALRFINKDVDNASNLTLNQIDSIIADIDKPNGGTKIGTNLREKILEPLVYRKLRSRGGLARPLLVSIITDGEPTDAKPSAFVEAITECGEKLAEKNYPRESVKFLISQIGTAKSAERFLESLKQESSIQDVVSCTSDQLDAKFNQLKDNEGKLDRWLIETLCAPIMMRN